MLNEIQESALSAIEGYLAKFLGKAAKSGFEWNAEMAQYQFSTGGKRLRAIIPCAVYAAAGRAPLEAVPLGCAIEMIHNATLVHDDLQDGDTVRRGKPTVWKKYGEAQSINCGDAMFQFGHQLLLELPLEPALLRRMGLRFLAAVTRVIEGQAQEFLLKDVEFPTLAGYLRVIEGKTAALVAASFALAAEALGKDERFCRELEKAGMDLGVLFQMQDDLLDLYGEKGRDRKATDIAEGKISALIAHFVETAKSADRDTVLRILRKPRNETSEADILEVLDLFETYRTREAIVGRIEKIREDLRTASWRTREPKIHALVLEMAELFLAPIAHLMPEPPRHA